MYNILVNNVELIFKYSSINTRYLKNLLE